MSEQPPPKRTDGPAMQDLVIADIEERKRVGVERYGTLLQAFNGRDPARDAYEEALDGVFYAKQALIERDAYSAKLERALQECADAGSEIGRLKDERDRAQENANSAERDATELCIQRDTAISERDRLRDQCTGLASTLAYRSDRIRELEGALKADNTLVATAVENHTTERIAAWLTSQAASYEVDTTTRPKDLLTQMARWVRGFRWKADNG